MAVSSTCHTTTLAISMGLPTLSLTFRTSPFSVRARIETLVDRPDAALAAVSMDLESDSPLLLTALATASSAAELVPMLRL